MPPSKILQTDGALFHVEYFDGSVHLFMIGDLARYNDEFVTVVGVPDTVYGHYRETPAGGLICLDMASVMLGGRIVTVETHKLFPVQQK